MLQLDAAELRFRFVEVGAKRWPNVLTTLTIFIQFHEALDDVIVLFTTQLFLLYML